MRLAGLLCLLALVGCGGDGSGSAPADMASTMSGDLAPLSSCGHPGDVGNALGVGKFCRTIADCMGNGLMTNICSALGNGATPSANDTYFCTIYPCQPDGGTTECGDNASCVCGSGSGGSGCACTPRSCK